MMTQVLNDGLILMSIGMGVVFGFLVVLVISMIIMSKIVGVLNKIFPEVVPEQKIVTQKRVGKDEEEIAIAIALAVRNM